LKPYIGTSTQPTSTQADSIVDQLRSFDQGDDVQELGYNKNDNHNSDEIDEKAEAVEMLSCLVEETGAGFVDYIGPTQKILLGVINYHLSD
jgi:hypothetical protein